MNNGLEDPRVLRLITRLNVGGPARQALLLTRELQNRYDTVLAAGTPESHEGELSDPNIEVTRLPLVRPINPRLDAQALLRVRSLITTLRPAIIHTHMAKAGTVGRLAALSTTNRPITIHTFHGHVLEGYFSDLTSRTFREAERLVAHRTDMLLAVSPQVRDELLSLGIGREDRFRVLPLGLDLDRFAIKSRPAGTDLRDELGIAPGTPLVGIVGRLVAIKDHATAFQAISALDGVHLAVIGDGELKSELEELAIELGIADRVHFTGWHPDVAQAISWLDVVLLTSRNEGTPVSLIEAAAAGRAVVATDVGGVRHVVEHGVTGIIVKPGDPRASAAAISSLLADPQTRQAMGQAGRTRSLSRFGKDQLISNISSLYEELLATAMYRRRQLPL